MNLVVLMKNWLSFSLLSMWKTYQSMEIRCDLWFRELFGFPFFLPSQFFPFILCNSLHALTLLLLFQQKANESVFFIYSFIFTTPIRRTHHPFISILIQGEIFLQRVALNLLSRSTFPFVTFSLYLSWGGNNMSNTEMNPWNIEINPLGTYYSNMLCVRLLLPVFFLFYFPPIPLYSFGIKVLLALAICKSVPPFSCLKMWTLQIYLYVCVYSSV